MQQAVKRHRPKAARLGERSRDRRDAPGTLVPMPTLPQHATLEAIKNILSF